MSRSELVTLGVLATLEESRHGMEKMLNQEKVFLAAYTLKRICLTVFIAHKTT